MSRIGKLPIAIPAGVTVEVNENVVTVKGAKDTLTQEFSKNVTVKVEENQVVVTRNDETTDSNAKQGLYRQLIQNMVTGVKEGFSKSLTVKGVNNITSIPNLLDINTSVITWSPKIKLLEKSILFSFK